MATPKQAKADVDPVRQRTQYSCMAASMAMCLRALGFDTDEDEVNKVMGARPMRGAAWEEALATAQHYGCRATLTVPATVRQLKTWTDQGLPVMIAWNPEGRDWSHASVVYDVTEGAPDPLPPSCIRQGEGEGFYLWIADPNIPNPEKTTRIVHENVFYGKWYEKWPNYLVRRPACVIDREITRNGRQVLARKKKPSRPAPKTQEDRRKDKAKVRGKAPKSRGDAARGLVDRGGAGAGRHLNKGQRGTGLRGKGKRQRHPKHRNRQEWRQAQASRVAHRFLTDED